ncbi:hypothetical protein [Streptomyces sp. NBC_01304]|uniref:hypothetical protein n=1 Tax=Streptomyces sp. NBC_01304 TaxID=2903818 RepID=UPI002E0F13C2|nr:hypothetical protein OG430_48400 [Streptomyces sp. NBC_01304]
MPQHPVTRCPRCDSGDLGVQLAETPARAQHVASFVCIGCGYTWRTSQTSQFPAPDYPQAYGAAPGLDEEEITLGLWAAGINHRTESAQAGHGRPVDSGGFRLFYLRQAAYLDRVARQTEVGLYCGLFDADDAEQARRAADAAAMELLTFDLAHGEVYVEGPLGPAAEAWQQEGGARAYVRQEYREWRNWEDAAAALRREYLSGDNPR